MILIKYRVAGWENTTADIINALMSPLHFLYMLESYVDQEVCFERLSPSYFKLCDLNQDFYTTRPQRLYLEKSNYLNMKFF